LAWPGAAVRPACAAVAAMAATAVCSPWYVLHSLSLLSVLPPPRPLDALASRFLCCCCSCAYVLCAVLHVLLPWCASCCCSMCHDLALVLCLYWCSPLSGSCLCVCHYCCCSSCIHAHEHPMMLMAYQVVPAIATAARLTCVFIFLAPGLITVVLLAICKNQCPWYVAY
jgi:hypothetical protein